MSSIDIIRAISAKRLEKSVYSPSSVTPLGANTDAPVVVNWKTGEPFEKDVEPNLQQETEPVLQKEVELESNVNEAMIDSVLENFRKRKSMFDPSRILTPDASRSNTKRTYANDYQ